LPRGPSKRGNIHSIAIGKTGEWVIVYDGNGFSNSVSLPQLGVALHEINQKRESIPSIAMISDDVWLFVHKQNSCYHKGISSDMIDALKGMITDNARVQHVAISESGAWVIIDNGYGYACGKVPSRCWMP
jgi:hypothetical protein